MTAVELDIVIPVRRGDSNLATCLRHLQEALDHLGIDSGSALHPVTVVCEACSDPEDSWEESLITRFPELDLDFVHCDGSVAYRRSVGAERGQAALVAFIDSDVYVFRDGLAQLLSLAERQPDMAGYAGATPLQEMSSRWGKASSRMPYASAFSFALAGYPLIWAPTTLLLVRRSKASGQPWFKSFAPPLDCSEDVDFGYRVTKRLGAPAIASTGTSVAVHAAAWDEAMPAIERAWRFGKGDASLLRAHPTEFLPAPSVLPAVVSVAALTAGGCSGWLVWPVTVFGAAVGGRQFCSPEHALLFAVHAASQCWHRLVARKIGRRFIFHEYQVLSHIRRLSRHGWQSLALLTGCILILRGRPWFHIR